MTYNELISKRDAIDAAIEAVDGWDGVCNIGRQKRIENYINSLPSAEPEIIYCKDCKHFIRDDIEEYMPYGFYNTYFHAFCDKHWDKEQGEYIDVKLDDFCSFAERKEDG